MSRWKDRCPYVVLADVPSKFRPAPNMRVIDRCIWERKHEAEAGDGGKRTTLLDTHSTLGYSLR